MAPLSMSTRKRIAIATTLLLAGVVAFLTLTPVTAPAIVGGSDKLHHIVAFAALALPCAVLHPKSILWIAPLLVAFGGIIEVVQPAVGRSGEWADFIADTLGIGVGVLAGIVIRKLGSGADPSKDGLP